MVETASIDLGRINTVEELHILGVGDFGLADAVVVADRAEGPLRLDISRVARIALRDGVDRDGLGGLTNDRDRGKQEGRIAKSVRRVFF